MVNVVFHKIKKNHSSGTTKASLSGMWMRRRIWATVIWEALVDKKAAVKWYSRAADSGDADALFNLGQCYKSGDGVPVNMADTKLE